MGGERLGSVLVVDDDDSLLGLLTIGLDRCGFEATGAPSAEAALAWLSGREPDLVLADVQLPGRSGVQLCEEVRARYPEVPVVIMTAFASYDGVVQVMRAGAYDFLAKPVDIDLIRVRLERIVEERRNRRELARLRQEVEAARSFEDLEGESAEMQRLYSVLSRVAVTDATVLLMGESGTGKEIAARALHRRGARRDGPFVAINCSALPEPLLESELFGHVRGAFTDAHIDRDGLFVQASTGTLLLDEIGDLPLGLQPKLLRAIEERRVRPLGSTRERSFDVRLIAATHRNLDEDVAAGRFREDLKYRLDVVRVNLPPLRARGSDVLTLARHFLTALARARRTVAPELSPEATRAILDYSWPGNVRELRNAIERALALATGRAIRIDDLPDSVRTARRAANSVTADSDEAALTLEEVERRHIERVLAAFGGNKRAAARSLGLDRKTLYRKLAQFGLGDVDDSS